MPEAPRLSSLKYQVTSVLSSRGSTKVLQIADRAPGGGTYVLKVVEYGEPAADLSIERMRRNRRRRPSSIIRRS